MKGDIKMSSRKLKKPIRYIVVFLYYFLIFNLTMQSFICVGETCLELSNVIKDVYLWDGVVIVLFGFWFYLLVKINQIGYDKFLKKVIYGF